MRDPQIGTDAPADKNGIVEVVTSPYSNNRNLAAQRGIHLLYRPVDVPYPTVIIKRDTLDDALRRAHANAIRDYKKALFKFVSSILNRNTGEAAIVVDRRRGCKVAERRHGLKSQEGV